MSEKGTEQATPQRKTKAREEGDFVRSRELMSAVAMLGGVLVIGAATNQFVRLWMRFYVETLAGLNNVELTSDRCIEIVRRTMLTGLTPVALVMAATFAGALLMGLLQGGGIAIHAKSIALNFERLNPATNLGHLFSLRSTIRVLKSLVPAAVMMLFGVYALRSLMLRSPVMSMIRLPQTFLTAYGLALDAACVTLAWSGLDYAIEWRARNERLKMTKQQIREEMRDATGDPQIKARIRQIQRAMRRRRVRTDISRASVLITNPTHYAVALEFSFETMQAPTVLAKGRDLHALEMREQARWAGVPIVENPPLARSLYQAVEPGSAIPFALYQAVAGILAFLYRQQVEERMRAERATRMQQTDALRDTGAARGYTSHRGERGLLRTIDQTISGQTTPARTSPDQQSSDRANGDERKDNTEPEGQPSEVREAGSPNTPWTDGEEL